MRVIFCSIGPKQGGQAVNPSSVKEPEKELLLDAVKETDDRMRLGGRDIRSKLGREES